MQRGKQAVDLELKVKEVIKEKYNIDVSCDDIGKVLEVQSKQIALCIQRGENVRIPLMGAFKFNYAVRDADLYRKIIGDSLSEKEIVKNIKSGKHIKLIKEVTGRFFDEIF